MRPILPEELARETRRRVEADIIMDRIVHRVKMGRTDMRQKPKGEGGATLASNYDGLDSGHLLAPPRTYFHPELH